MDAEQISPAYLLDLADKIERELWKRRDFSKYKYVENYIERWHVVDDSNSFCAEENFHIFRQEDENGNIDLNKTLARMPSDILLKIAFDLGLDTPGYLPVIAERFKTVLSKNNKNARDVFSDAIMNVYSNPEDSVLDASSALDGLLKLILSDSEVSKSSRKPEGLSKRFDDALSTLKLTKKSGAPEEIYKISSSLNNIAKEIDNLRSNKTNSHGKLQDEYVVDDPLFAELCVNSAATVGIFLWEYYEKNFTSKDSDNKDDGELEIDLEDIPF